MTNQLHALAEAEARKRVYRMEITDGKEAVGFRNGFIAGRTSVEVTELAKVIDAAIYVSINPLLERGSWNAAQRAARDVLALLRGETDE